MPQRPDPEVNRDPYFDNLPLSTWPVSGGADEAVTPEWQQLLLRLLLGFFGYAAGAIISVEYMKMGEGVSLCWLPNAIPLALLLTQPHRHWPAYLLVILPAEIVADLPHFSLLEAGLFWGVNSGEVLLAALLLRGLKPAPFQLHQMRSVVLFVVGAMLLSSMSAAFGGAAIHYWIVQPDLSLNYWRLWQVWWFGDAIGLLVVTPLLLVALDGFRAGSQLWQHRSDRMGLLLLLLCTALLTLLIFGPWGARLPLIPLLLLPLLLLAAVRYELLGAAATGVVLSLIAIYFTAHGSGPIAQMGSRQTALLLQEYLLVLLLSALMLATLASELRQRERERAIYQRALHASSDGIVLTDPHQPDNPITWINPAFERITGYRHDEVVGQNCRLLRGGDHDQEGVLVLRSAVMRGESASALLRNYRKDGSLFWNQLHIAPVRDSSGAVCHFVGIQRDVTTQVEDRQLLQQARDELQRVNSHLERRVAERTYDLQRANAELERLAATDPLTGIANRRRLLLQLEFELDRGQRQQLPLSLILLDIDHFKSINDTYGHPVGDQVLLGLSGWLQRSLRPYDLPARYGGEEFIVLLPGTSGDDAYAIAQRLCRKLPEEQLSDAEPQLRISASFGVCDWWPSRDSAELEPLLQRVDQALYQAKRDGRRQVASR